MAITGGHVGILYAHRYAANVKSMLLTGSSGLYENNTLGTFPKRHSRTYIQERVEYTFYDAKTATPALVDEVFAIVQDNRKCFRIVKTAKTAQRNYVTKELPEINMPVLLIWGADDNITPPAVAEEFEKMLPNVKLVYLKECGHAPMMEKPRNLIR
ncbi:alpha/beta fold hydrolase [Chitinophaga pinensis]|uniref:alpha/beta fold hydrolase n=1 Tax=Chitinophaga pinensis TaxID=79329 RepID=UPI001C9987FA|nr:alpha/beta hydrolase [Chitinophaga pinensis]